MRHLSFFVLIVAGLSEATQAAITSLGGEGTSLAKAVRIHGAVERTDGVPAQDAWLDRQWPGYGADQQALQHAGGHVYDRLKGRVTSKRITV